MLIDSASRLMVVVSLTSTSRPIASIGSSIAVHSWLPNIASAPSGAPTASTKARNPGNTCLVGTGGAHPIVAGEHADVRPDPVRHPQRRFREAL